MTFKLPQILLGGLCISEYFLPNAEGWELQESTGIM
jgi:hypothetical protein